MDGDRFQPAPGRMPPAAAGGPPTPARHPLLHPPVTLLLAPVVLALATPLLAPPGKAQAQAASAVAADAEQVYLADCASCHGDGGGGTNRGPPLEGVGSASTHYYLTTGRMPIDEPHARIVRQPPAYRPELIEALVTHVEGFGGGGPGVPSVSLDSADVANGGTLYRSQCASCHATAGAGGALLYQHAPSVLQATPIQTADAIRVGPGTMPAFGEAALGDDELNDVVAYVDYLNHPNDRGGLPLWHLGPLIEGLAGWVLGMGILVLLGLWIGKGP